MAVIIAVALAGALAGCGGSDKGGDPSTTAAPKQTQTPKRSIEGSSAAADSLGQLQAEPQRGGDAGIDFNAYDNELAGMVELLNRYWKSEEPNDYRRRRT
jgi:hypothetical protein